MKYRDLLNPRSLSGTGFLSILVTILVLAPAIGGVWIFSEYHKKKHEYQRIRDQHTQFYQDRLRTAIQNHLDFIEYKKSGTEERIRDLVQERVLHAYSLAAHLYDMGKDKKSLPELQSAVVETLRPIRWDDGKGYYFILDASGKNILHADMPELEGRDMSETKDSEGRYIIRDMLSVARIQDSGFYGYRWAKPLALGLDHLKISYIKNFEPFQWAICAGFYFEDMEAHLKNEVIRQVSLPTGDPDRYVFILQTDGFLVYHPSERYHRKNIFMHAPPDKQDIYLSVMAIARQQSLGFVEYPIEKPSTGQMAKKLTCAAYVPGWDWFIGTGIYLDDLEQIIEAEKQAFRTDLKHNVLMIAGITFSVIFLALIPGLLITGRLAQGMAAFADFFSNAATSSIKISENQLLFKEFTTLGRLANQMQEDRINREKHLQQALQEITNAQDLLKNITDSMPSARIAVDADLNITHWNRKIETLTGIAAGQAEGRRVTGLLHLTEDEIRIIEKTLADGIPRTRPRTVEADGHDRRHEDITVYPLSARMLQGAVIRIDDTTEKRKLEEIMIQSEKMLSVGGLAAGMAHEINNPLAGIIGSTDVLKNRLLAELPANEDAAREAGITPGQIRLYAEKRGLPAVLETIRQAGNRAAAIVSDMLSFSRMSTASFSLCSLEEILDKTVDMASAGLDLKKNLDFKKIRIIRDYDPSLPPVLCDQNKIRQVFLNILSNGAHAMAETEALRPPEFRLKLYRDGPEAVIRIQDNGPGIPLSIRKRIFEPFFTTRDVGVGTGLGLSVSYFIITSHHKGSILVESETGRGTAFIIRIPVSRDASGNGPKVREPASSPSGSGRWLPDKTRQTL